MARLQVRPLHVDDAEGVARVHVAAWRAGYRGLLAATVLDGLDEERSARRWRERAGECDEAAVPPDGLRVLVAHGPSGPVGMIQVGPARDDPAVAAVELQSLNVDPEHWRTGIGLALVAEALPPGPAYLWVLEGNERAIRFYARFGFVLDGGRKEDSRLHCTDLRMVR